MIARAVAWLVSRPWLARELIFRAMRTPYTFIHTPDGRQVYMRRWWLFNPYDPETRACRFPWLPSVRVHQICLPDHDQDLHDHPWNFRTFVLAGEYIEEREGRKVSRRRPGDTATLKHGEFHRIAWVSPVGGAWTLFITGPYRGGWGFLVDGVKVPYKEYLAARRST